MPSYQYHAVNESGAAQRGTLEADSEQQARQLLREQKLFPVEIKGLNSKGAGRFGLLRPRIKPLELALLTRQLASLLAAGLPLSDALSGLNEQAAGQKSQPLIGQIHSQVLAGQSLASALRAQPKVFSKLYCATIEAGEQTGELATVLNELALYLEAQYQTRQRLLNALIYPSLMLIVAFGIISFLLIYVVPKIITIFTSTGQQLPTATLVLLGLSRHLSQAAWIYALLFIALLILGKRLLAYPQWRYRFDQFLLKLPLVGYSIRTINLARYTHTLGILLQAGVPILRAMHVSSALLTPLPMLEKIQAAESKVGEGANIYLALKQTGYFPPLTLHLISSGEKSGTLSNMLRRVSDQLHDDVNRLIQTLMSLFEPLIIVIMGSVVLFIVLAILLPIFSMNEFIQ